MAPYAPAGAAQHEKKISTNEQIARIVPLLLRRTEPVPKKDAPVDDLQRRRRELPMHVRTDWHNDKARAYAARVSLLPFVRCLPSS